LLRHNDLFTEHNIANSSNGVYFQEKPWDVTKFKRKV